MQCTIQNHWEPSLDRKQGNVCLISRPGQPLGHHEYLVSRDQLGGLHLQRMAETKPGSGAYSWRLVAVAPADCDCGCGGFVSTFSNHEHKRPELDAFPEWAAGHIERIRSMPVHVYKRNRFGAWSRPPVVTL